MFGFGGRKKYNGVVDTKLNNEYQISTQGNPNFPAPLAYLNLIDTAWNSSMSADEAALYVATLYYCGTIKHGLHAEEAALWPRIQAVVRFGLEKGLITKAQWDKYESVIKRTKGQAAG